jgi:geranylgeranyl reductase family protein
VAPPRDGSAAAITASASNVAIADERVHDVVVVGAGPAGAVAAALLAERGRRVLLLERSRAPVEKICGEYLCPRALVNLRRLKLTTQIERRRPRAIDGMVMVAPDGTEVVARFRAADGSPSGGWSLPRAQFDGALQEEARVRGATLLFDASVVEVCCEEGRVLVAARVGGEERPRSFAASFVVGADGRFSLVARRLGLARAPRGRPRGVVHAWLRGVEAIGARGEMHLLRDGSYLGVDPLADGRVNVSLVGDAEVVAAAARERRGFELLRAAIALAPSLARRSAGAELAGEVRYLAPVRSDVTSAVAPRALLVGDAAGFLDPLTGEGIHVAIADAELAAAAIERALARGRGDVRALRPYARAVARARRGKALLHPLLQALLRHPRVGNAIAARLAQRPAAAERLLAVVGNLRGAASLAHPRFVGALLRAPARTRAANA